MVDCPICKQREENAVRLRIGMAAAIIGAAVIMIAYVATHGLPPTIS